MPSEVKCPYSNNGGALPCLSGELVDYCHGECYGLGPRIAAALPVAEGIAEVEGVA
jgi:hypothetical protein